MEKIVYILLEENSDIIKYMAMGEVVNNKFNGFIFASLVKGKYTGKYVYQDKYLLANADTHSHLDNEDIAKIWLDNLCPHLKDVDFVEKYDDCMYWNIFDRLFYVKKNRNAYSENTHYDGKVLFQGKKFVPISFGDIKFSKKEEYWSLEELKSFIDWKTVIKEEFDRFQVINDVKLSSNDLLVKTAEFFKGDLVWKDLIDTKKAIKFLETIVQNIEACDEDIYDINIRDCDICDCCGKVLLPNDELYISHNGETLCDICSVRCEDCEEYFSVNDKMTNIDGALVCSNCAKKQKFEVQAKRTEYIKTEIYANSYEEAVKIAEEHFELYSWKEIDGSLHTEIQNKSI